MLNTVPQIERPALRALKQKRKFPGLIQHQLHGCVYMVFLPLLSQPQKAGFHVRLFSLSLIEMLVYKRQPGPNLIEGC